MESTILVILTSLKMMMIENLESYFDPFRRNTIGFDLEHSFPQGTHPLIYADWIASGRLYRPIESFLSDVIGPYVGNTHTETTLVGTTMGHAYHQAQQIIKAHVNASKEDVLVFSGFGMTSVINKFQRILGFRIPERYQECVTLCEEERPLVLITHMEHHSNQTTWIECLCDVEIIHRAPTGLPDLNHMEELLKKYENRRVKIGSFSACSNVSGIITPYHEMAEIMHNHNGLCFIDFAASAPYVTMDMHPKNPKQKLDAIFFSPHKFLGGPGASGVMVFDQNLYQNEVPDHPGGGTVMWTNPWGEHRYFTDIEVREDGGTPGFLQAIKASLAIQLKEEMAVPAILKRECDLKQRFLKKLHQNPFIQTLESQHTGGLGVVSFYSRDKHFNLIVTLLNDYFGIQTRGGCSCAGTYGHVLLDVDREMSKAITKKIDCGDLTEKPGWVRVSLHPTMTEAEVDFIADAIHQVITHYDSWKNHYQFIPNTGEFHRAGTNRFSIDLKHIRFCD